MLEVTFREKEEDGEKGTQKAVRKGRGKGTRKGKLSSAREEEQ